MNINNNWNRQNLSANELLAIYFLPFATLKGYAHVQNKAKKLPPFTIPARWWVSAGNMNSLSLIEEMCSYKKISLHLACRLSCDVSAIAREEVKVNKLTLSTIKNKPVEVV